MCCILRKVLFLTFYLFQMPYMPSLYVYINNIKTYSCPIIYLIGLNLLPLQCFIKHFVVVLQHIVFF